MSYKTKFITMYVIGSIFVMISLFVLVQSSRKSDITHVSKDYFQNSFNEHEDLFHNFFMPYFAALKALQKNITFRDYIEHNESSRHLEKVFVSLKEFLPFLMQVSFVDAKGMEQVRIEGTAAHNTDELGSAVVVPPITTTK